MPWEANLVDLTFL